MTNRCICCTLRDDLLEEVDRLAREGRFDYLLIESSGISGTMPVAATFSFPRDDGATLGDLAALPVRIRLRHRPPIPGSRALRSSQALCFDAYPHGSRLRTGHPTLGRGARAFAHLHWFRRLRIRWEIRDDIHEAFLALGCALMLLATPELIAMKVCRSVGRGLELTRCFGPGQP